MTSELQNRDFSKLKIVKLLPIVKTNPPQSKQEGQGVGAIQLKCQAEVETECARKLKPNLVVFTYLKNTRNVVCFCVWKKKVKTRSLIAVYHHRIKKLKLTDINILSPEMQKNYKACFPSQEEKKIMFTFLVLQTYVHKLTSDGPRGLSVIF